MEHYESCFEFVLHVTDSSNSNFRTEYTLRCICNENFSRQFYKRTQENFLLHVKEEIVNTVCTSSCIRMYSLVAQKYRLQEMFCYAT